MKSKVLGLLGVETFRAMDEEGLSNWANLFKRLLEAILGEGLADEYFENPPTPESLEKKRRAIQEMAFRALNFREATSLCLRNGLTDGLTYTLDECARHCGNTRERVRQLEARAIRKLQERKSGLRELLLDPAFDERVRVIPRRRRSNIGNPPVKKMRRMLKDFGVPTRK